MENRVEFYRMSKTSNPKILNRITEQILKAGFSGNIKVYDLGLDDEASMSLIVEGTYENEDCCVAVGYGMNRQNLAIRKKWFRHAP
ncbi:hypothetical protein LZ24_01307 [Desulfobotulus alkaliphilus]|uniref:Uncharacterized protein n=1 Tax=Desulfobotulus alkaliphilus TaxID=622671 RepID=A0A562RVT5_9BACT|nr:hypothetical protein [Desulfobotulus alkaliphilus]TWI73219.1 hypothetical protein LZ24_01307 [Desulfobotulus alkaliphilus]